MRLGARSRLGPTPRSPGVCETARMVPSGPGPQATRWDIVTQAPLALSVPVQHGSSDPRGSVPARRSKEAESVGRGIWAERQLRQLPLTSRGRSPGVDAGRQSGGHDDDGSSCSLTALPLTCLSSSYDPPHHFTPEETERVCRQPSMTGWHVGAPGFWCRGLPPGPCPAFHDISLSLITPHDGTLT